MTKLQGILENLRVGAEEGEILRGLWRVPAEQKALLYAYPTVNVYEAGWRNFKWSWIAG